MLWTLLVISLISLRRSHFDPTATDICITQNEIQLSEKNTSQSSNYTNENHEPYVSGRAIDKDRQKCAHTNAANNSWWTIDLGDVYNISCISIYNKDHHNSKMNGAQIHIGNSSVKNGTENKVWKNITGLKLNEFDSFKFDEVVWGRYVTVTIPANQHVVLCEVKIYKATVFELVRKNMTWEHALYYCREQWRGYKDLASIHDSKTQVKLAELVKNATTKFVWLGYRYSCTLDFWFWVDDSPKDYVKWATKNETDKICDSSAAMGIDEEDGGLFSKPDKEMYNFICVK